AGVSVLGQAGVSVLGQAVVQAVVSAVISVGCQAVVSVLGQAGVSVLGQAGVSVLGQAVVSVLGQAGVAVIGQAVVSVLGQAGVGQAGVSVVEYMVGVEVQGRWRSASSGVDLKGASRIARAYEPTPGAPGAGGHQETAPGRFWHASVASMLHRVGSGDEVRLPMPENHRAHAKIA
ncbi:hypothetical protein Q9L58_010530, partial [Maublancomyces gigas]